MAVTSNEAKIEEPGSRLLGNVGMGVHPSGFKLQGLMQGSDTVNK